MPCRNAKIYYDGSHYIAIPQSGKIKRRRPKSTDNEFIVVEKEETSEKGNIKSKRLTTKKDMFEEAYKRTPELKPSEKKESIMREMQEYFDTPEQTEEYVRAGMERKRRNLICRRIRIIRKASLAGFNYFCTFTYDGKKHTEESFRRGLNNCLRSLSSRKEWRYAGVWERSPEKQRLHFHGLFRIPANTLKGGMIEVTDYSTTDRRKQTSVQSVYFNERFGRSDFKALEPRLLTESIDYLVKYIEKTGEKIVYSKGLYQYFVSDVTDDDVICRTGREEKKLLLADNFRCWSDGEYVGIVSAEVISKLKKSN